MNSNRVLSLDERYEISHVLSFDEIDLDRKIQEESVLAVLDNENHSNKRSLHLIDP